MAAPVTAWVPRKAARASIARSNPPPVHRMATRVPLVDQGDPFDYHVVRYGQFYQQGKPWHDPGVNVNFYQSIPAIQAVAEKFWGRIAPKLRYRKQTNIPRGRMAALGHDANIERPQPMTVGELYTFSNANRQVIHSTIGPG